MNSHDETTDTDRKVLIAYFSWSGNTRSITKRIEEMTGADRFELRVVTPYSTDYDTVVAVAKREQRAQARPKLSTHVEDMAQYDTLVLGYPNWWSSVPMPVATFLEEYNLTGKAIVPLCSHGGGRFGHSLEDLATLVPGATLGEGLQVLRAGGAGLPADLSAWLRGNGISEQ